MEEKSRYSYTWSDGGTVCYTVEQVSAKFIYITFDNGASNFFSVGSPMYYGSKKI